MLNSIRNNMLIFLLGIITISIIVIAYLGINSIIITGNNAQQITAITLRNKSEEFLVQLTISAAEKNDLILERVREDASNVATYAKNIFENPDTFANGTYWKFDDHIFMGPWGQHLNGKDDVSSVFIPNQINVTEDLKKELELNAYLDFVFPKALENEPNAVAIYTIGLKGESRYYPNIGLGNILSPNEMPSEEIFFTVANPSNNPERKVAWTPVYDDPAGNGLMITASAPIYTKQKGFVGVIGIDVTLNKIIKNIEKYNPIENSYSFLIDKDGYSIALPEEAYKDILGRNREANESRVNLNNLTNEFNSVINKMKEGSTDFQSITINNKELYVAYAPLESTGFSFGIVVEKAVLLKAVSDLQKEVEDSTQKMIYFRFLPAGLLILAIVWIISLFYIQRIIKPIQDLTKTAEKISRGNLNVKLNIISKNEIGQLASTFNQMVKELKKSKANVEKYSKNLEKQVSERTEELNKRVEELTDAKNAMLNMTEDLDETNRRLMEAQSQLKKSFKELKKLDVDKDRFISIAAHELKTPMTAISGFAQLLENEKIIENKEIRSKYLKIIETEIKRLSKLVTEVLDLSRIDLGTMKFTIEDVDIIKQMEEIKNEMTQRVSKKGLKLYFNIDRKLPIIKTDKEKLMEILINLIDNAVKYTPKGSIKVEIRKEGDHIKFSVADTGIGVSKKYFSRLFTRFYQIESPFTRKAGGTGLGLSICKEYVENLSGKIWLKSKVGKGTTFYFTLPIKTTVRKFQ
jgi:signal transduction histidine kinase